MTDSKLTMLDRLTFAMIVGMSLLPLMALTLGSMGN